MSLALGVIDPDECIYFAVSCHISGQQALFQLWMPMISAHMPTGEPRNEV